MNLADRRCVVPLPKGTPRLAPEQLPPLLAEVPQWRANGDRLVRTFTFKDFAHAIAYVNIVAAIAEEQNHHPDITIRYNKVDISSWTHDVDGLSENDFILAAKLTNAAETLRLRTAE